MLKEKNSLPLFRSFVLAGGIGIGILSLSLVFGVWKTIDRLASFFAPAVPKVEVSSLIVDRVRALSELTTASFIMETIVPTSQAQKVGNFVLAETRLLYIANGEVKAGINLEKITPDAVTVDGDRIRIQLPPPEILDSKIDVTKSRVYDYNRGFLGLGPDVAPELQTLAQKETLARILTAACQRGILQEANEKAKLSLTRIFQTSGYPQVEVIVREPENCSLS